MDIGISGISSGYTIGSSFNEKQPFYVKAEKKSGKSSRYTTGEGRLVWLHAASLGEFEGRPVISLEAAEPATQIPAYLFSPSG